jgi:hypothetical protein
MAGETSERLRLAFLICSHIALSCVSLVYVAEIRTGFHILYDPSRLYGAMAAVIAFAAVAWLFTFADFSFGYLVGFYLYTMVLGYLWLNCFSDLDYDHRLFGLSAAISAIAFLLPALLITAPIRQIYAMSATAFDGFLTLFSCSPSPQSWSAPPIIFDWSRLARSTIFATRWHPRRY